MKIHSRSGIEKCDIIHIFGAKAEPLTMRKSGPESTQIHVHSIIFSINDGTEVMVATIVVSGKPTLPTNLMAMHWTSNTIDTTQRDWRQKQCFQPQTSTSEHRSRAAASSHQAKKRASDLD